MAQEIWWPEFCGNWSGYDAFWNDNLTLYTPEPDLTNCFQNTVLIWIPCGFLLLVLPIYAIHLAGKKSLNGWREKSLLNWIKLVFSLLIVLDQAAVLIKTIHTDTTGGAPEPVDYVAPALMCAIFMIVMVLQHVEFCRGVRSSGVLVIFWTLTLLSVAITFRSQILQNQRMNYIEDMFRYSTVIIFFGLAIVEWIISFFVETKVTRGKYSVVRDERTPLFAEVETQPSETTIHYTVLMRKTPPISPELSANVLNAVFYAWTFKLLLRGYRHHLTFDDVYASNEADKCDTVVPAFLKQWHRLISDKSTIDKYESETKKSTSGYSRLIEDDDKETSSSHQGRSQSRDKTGKVSDYTIVKALFKTFKWHLLKGTSFRILYVPVSFLSPLLLRVLLQYLMSDDPHAWKGYVLAVLLGLSSISLTIVHNRGLYHDYANGIRMRAAVQAAIYRKALRLSTAAKRQTTVGQIVNLMSVDTERMVDSPMHFSMCLSLILTGIVFTVFMWQTVGVASLAGLGVIVLAIPFNGVVMANKIRQQQVKQMVHKDQRLKTVGEILSGMKVLKLYAWEGSYLQKVLGIRDRELKTVKRINYLLALNSVFVSFSANLIFFVIILIYILTAKDYVLSADTAFVTLSLINVLGWPMSLFAAGVAHLGQTAVAVVRINKFLTLDEVPDGVVTFNPTQKPAIQIRDGCFSWGRGDPPALTSINLDIPAGSLVAIVGQVGSGKSSLMSSMLGEMWKLSGTVSLKGTLSYVPQQAWIQNDTLRGNILFGKSYNEATYSRILDACALRHDLTVLPDGDMTEIGEKGVNLSGGQKQRVSLARALYQDEDICLLDDPLSAVDAHVGKHLFEHVIGPNGMLRNRTRVLATHNVTFLTQMDQIFVMRDGEVSEAGTYEELLQEDADFAEFLRTYVSDTATDTTTDESELEQKPVEMSANDTQELTTSGRGLRKRLTQSGRSKEGSSLGSHDQQPKALDAGKLIQEERSDVGNIRWDVIRYYVMSGGLLVFFVVVFFNLLVIAVLVYANIWLSEWTSDPIINGTRTREERDYRLGVYGALLLGQIFLSIAAFMAVGLGCFLSTRTMHKQLLERILHAPMSFFDTTPLGRILNRMSKDTDGADTWVPNWLLRWITAAGYLAGAFIIMAYAIPIFLVAAIPVSFLYFLLMRVYIKTATQLRRIDSVRKSPLLSHFDESIVGASSIRAYRQQDRFTQTNDHLVENCSRSWYLIRANHRFLNVMAGTVGCVMVLSVSCFSVAMRDSLTAGIAGLAITYAIQVGLTLNVYMWGSTELETYMVAIERIYEYTKVEQEAAWEIEETKPDSSWPSTGAVEYHNLSTKYRPELGLVLRDVSFTVSPGEKLGVVGRTGAGKSSLTLSLFRIIEATGGDIYIDGIKISSLGLRDLRSQLTVIPQDPVIFSGSLRFNLDPFSKHTDRAIWEALSHAHLKRFVQSLPEGLDYECGEGGEALSVGQRQLLCLARALLRKTKVIVLDEATAAVDLETDDLIQQTIRSDFADRTILTVAHRLNTILDYDRVMVMDRGRIVEMDNPQKLLEDSRSVLHGMAKDAGLI